VDGAPAWQMTLPGRKTSNCSIYVGLYIIVGVMTYSLYYIIIIIIIIYMTQVEELTERKRQAYNYIISARKTKGWQCDR
jgi:hypothetical protein